MADVLPVQFRKSSPFLFNVDYFDYATGAGYKKYYPATGKDSTGINYFLSSDTSTISNSDFRLVFGDYDFDLDFNNNMKIAGAEAIFNGLVAVNASVTYNLTLTINVYHVSSTGTETLLGTETSETITGNNSNTTYAEIAVKISLTSKSFSQGEKLRVNVISSGTGTFTYFYADPSAKLSYTGTMGRTLPATCSINIPFEVEN